MATITKQESIHINKFNTNQSLISPGNYNVLSVNIPGGMNLRACEMAISELNVYNSIYNITSVLQNNQITILYPASTTTVSGYVFTVPDGLYGVDDLNAWLQTTLIANGLYSTISSVITTGISFAYSTVQLKVQVTVAVVGSGTAATPSTCTFGSQMSTFGPFTNTAAVFFGRCTGVTAVATPATPVVPVVPLNPTFGLAPIVGQPAVAAFTPAVTTYSAQYHFPTTGSVNTLALFPQDTAYNTVLLTCNLVNSTLMPQYNRVIYDYAPALAEPGTQLSFSPYPDFFDCQDGFYNNITITFVDETEAPVPINDPTMSVTLLIRPKQIFSAPQETDLGSRKRLGTELVPPPNEDDVRVEQNSLLARLNKRQRW